MLEITCDGLLHFLNAVYDATAVCASAAPFKDLFVEPEDLAKDNYLLYKRQQDIGGEETFENDELVTKHGFDSAWSKKAAMFANDEEICFCQGLISSFPDEHKRTG